MLDTFKLVKESEANGVLSSKMYSDIINSDVYDYNEEGVSNMLTHTMVSKINKLNNNINTAKSYVNNKADGFNSDLHSKNSIRFGSNKVKNIKREADLISKDIYRNINNKNISVADGNRLLSKIKKSKEKADILERLTQRKKINTGI